MKDITYGTGFKHMYQAKLMKLLFESILLEKVQEEFSNQRSKITFDANHPKYKPELDRILMSVTFEFYKKLCFNSWSFKNHMLASEEFVIHDYQKEDGVLPSMEKVAESLIKLKQEAESKRDEEAEAIFWPLINAVLVIVYTSMARRRLDAYNERIENCNKNIKKLTTDKNECTGKISVLNEVKGKVSKTLGENVSVDDNANIRNINNAGSISAIVNKNKLIERCQKIVDQSNEVVEELKRVDYEIEDKFQAFLKNVGNSLISSKLGKK